MIGGAGARRANSEPHSPDGRLRVAEERLNTVGLSSQSRTAHVRQTCASERDGGYGDKESVVWVYAENIGGG